MKVLDFIEEYILIYLGNISYVFCVIWKEIIKKNNKLGVMGIEKREEKNLL